MSIIRKWSVKAIIDRYSEISLPAKAAIWFAACSFLQRGISMISTPIFTRVLSTEEYGIFSTYNSWEFILYLIVSLCLYKCVMNLCVKFEREREAAFSSLCALGLILSLVWLAAGIIFRRKLSGLFGLSETLTVCLFVSFIGKLIYEFWSIYKRYYYEYKIIVTVTLVLALGSTAMGLLAVLAVRATAEMRVIASVAVYLAMGVYLYGKVFSEGRCVYKKEVWKFALGFCIPLLPHYLSEFVLQSSDKIMINYMCGPRDVALYSVAYSVGSLLTFFTGAINSSFAPYQYQKIAAKEYDVLAKRANQVLLIVSVCLIFLMLFSREIVLVVGGYRYLESAAVIIPICIGVYFNNLFQLFARAQEFFEQKLTIVIPSVLCAVLNIILNWIFIKIYGYAAAAYTTFFCYFVFCILHGAFYCRLCKKKLNGAHIYDIKYIILISGITILMGGVVGVLNTFPIVKYIILFTAVLAAVIKRKELCAHLKEVFGH